MLLILRRRRLRRRWSWTRSTIILILSRHLLLLLASPASTIVPRIRRTNDTRAVRTVTTPSPLLRWLLIDGLLCSRIWLRLGWRIVRLLLWRNLLLYV